MCTVESLEGQSKVLRRMAYRDSGNVSAQIAITEFASTLAGRFNPVVGCTRSWNSADPTDFMVRNCISTISYRKLKRSIRKVIIDNMMNLEVCVIFHALDNIELFRQVLFAAADINGNQTLREIAITHADTTIANHFRPDGRNYKYHECILTFHR